MALTKAHTRMIEGIPISVLDFGADRLGTSASHTQIQDAIDYASANGKAVYIPGGDYKIAGKITVPNYITIYGDGPETRLFRDTSVATFDMIEIKNTAHIALKDFLIDGVEKLDNGTAANRYCGVRIWSDGGVSPNDIEVVGLHINLTTSGEQQTEGNRAALMLEDCYDVRVSRCKFYGNRAAAIMISSKPPKVGPPYTTFQIQIEQCWGVGEQSPYDPTYPTGFGSFITGNQFEDVIVSGCFCKDFGFTNISLNGHRQTVQNCISIDSDYAGITLGHSTEGSRPEEVIAQGNICANNGQAGITVSSAENVVIANNVLTNNCAANTADGQIEIRWDSNYVANEAQKISITDNQLADSNGPGILCEVGTDVLISGNSIHDGALTGIFLTEKNATEVMNAFVTNNYIKDNGTGTRSAIEVNSDPGAGTRGQVNALCMNNTIYSSDIATKQGMGITAVGSLADVQVHENWFSTGYVGTLNTNFGARNTKAFNAFTSGTLTLSTRLLTP